MTIYDATFQAWQKARAAETLGIGSGKFLNKAVISGGSAGDHTVEAIKSGDELVAVLHFPIATGAVTSVADLTAEFTHAASAKINNNGGTDTSGGKLVVLWIKLTA